MYVNLGILISVLLILDLVEVLSLQYNLQYKIFKLKTLFQLIRRMHLQITYKETDPQRIDKKN